MPILTLDSIHTHIPGVGNPIGGSVRDHLEYPGEYGPSAGDVLRSWLAGDGQGPSSWRGLLDAPLRTDECHGWEDSIKLYTPDFLNYVL